MRNNKLMAAALSAGLVFASITPAIAAEESIAVESGYTYIKAGSHSRSALEAKREALKKAVSDNKMQVSAANMLIDMTPETIKGIRADLDRLIEKSNNLITKAEATIAELDKILG